MPEEFKSLHDVASLAQLPPNEGPEIITIRSARVHFYVKKQAVCLRFAYKPLMGFMVHPPLPPQRNNGGKDHVTGDTSSTAPVQFLPCMMQLYFNNHCQKAHPTGVVTVHSHCSSYRFRTPAGVIDLPSLNMAALKTKSRSCKVNLGSKHMTKVSSRS